MGSGTAAPEADRVCSGYWVASDDTRILLDCGPGTVHSMARLGLPWPRLDHVVITHFHNDHIGDLPVLLFALKWGVEERRTTPLTLWAPHGIQPRLTAMAAAFGEHVADPGFPVIIREVRPDDPFELGPVRATAAATPHTDHSVCYRLQDGNGVLGYTGDTGPSDSVSRFLARCDLLIAECSLPDDLAIHTHLSPGSLAAMAGRAEPRILWVTHVYPQLDALDPVKLVRAAGWDGEVARAVDGLVLRLEQQRPTPPPMDDPGATL